MDKRGPKKRGRRALTVAVSLFPRHQRIATQRAKSAKVTLSRYLQALIELDAARNILPQALTLNLQAP